MACPLEQWFDITKPIPKADAGLTQASMVLYALKDGMDPDCADAKRQYRRMRKAVADHNAKFPAPELSRSTASKLCQAKRQQEEMKGKREEVRGKK